MTDPASSGKPSSHVRIQIPRRLVFGGGLLVASALVVVVLIWLSWALISDANRWAGLGQWVGGLGALLAAGVALWISGREVRHVRENENHRQFAQAHFVTVEITLMHHASTDDILRADVHVSNEASEPVRNVKLLTLRGHSDTTAAQIDYEATLKAPTAAVLLPGKTWSPTPTGKYKDEVEGTYFGAPLKSWGLWVEFEFEDLHGNRWRRFGDESPRPA